MRALLLPLCAIVAAASCDCGEPLAELVPEIAVDPEVLELGDRQTGVRHDADVAVGNRGSGSLVLTGVRIEPDDGVFEVVSAPTSVPPRSALPLVVGFTVDAPGPHSAELILESNDPITPRLVVPLRAAGGEPRLFVSPNPLAFGRVNEGDGAARTLTVANDGLHPLSVTGLAFATDVGFVIDSSGLGPLPRRLGPGESGLVTVSLSPNTALVEAHGRTLQSTLVVSADVGAVDVAVSAEVNLAPRAIAVEERSRRTVVKAAIGDIVRIDGSDTVDPEGDAFSFAWSVAERPASSVMTVIGQGQPQTRVTPDVVGRAVVRLRTTDVHGAFREADVELLPRDLAVVLSWAPAFDAACRAFSAEQCAAFSESERRQRCCGQSDLDLHLVGPGGALGDYGACPAGCADVAFCSEESDEHVDTCRQTGLDCAFANRFPEWGSVGRFDDPSLDIDDVGGDGPEVITLNDPTDGSYRVLVHYCQDRIGEATDARITLLDQGAVIAELGPQRIAEGQAWLAAVLVRSAAGWQVVAAPGIFESTVPANLCAQ